ncbi:MAG: DinB family protein [Chitinophagaceae bacterium]|jgi:hypothetical protein|nr:DinB family protein [Chitinophagaceae bacterium]
MELKKAIKESFVQLTNVLDQLNDEEYTTVSANLSGATIGQHMRHVVEMYQCLLSGYQAGVVCYDQRKRDIAIETSKEFARNLLQQLTDSIDLENKDLLLISYFGDEASVQIDLPTNYYRELMYNLEHSVHHMALMKVGLKEFSIAEVSENFGVASSTIQYKKHVHSNIHTH